MRVLQLSTYDDGQGAARAAFRLHRALRDHGTDSCMRVALATSGDAWVHAPRSKPRQALALARSTASWWLSKPQRSDNLVTHSVAALPSRLDRELNASGADLLHLHNTGCYHHGNLRLFARLAVPTQLAVHHS